MRLGAPVDADPLDYAAYAAELVRQGYRAAQCPPEVTVNDPDKIRHIKRVYSERDVMIGEVGAWSNALDPRPEERKKNIEYVAQRLALADELGARCAVNCVGSFDLRLNYQAHPENFTEACFDAVVEWVRRVLDDVKPGRTKMTLEIAPWTLLDGPEVYRRLVRAIDHPGLGVHLDPVNAVGDVHTYFSTTSLLEDCFNTLGEWIVCCHAKDIVKHEDPTTVAFREVAPGKGVMDYRTFLLRCEKLSPDLPVLMEHLETVEAYREAAEYIRSVARDAGVTI